MQKHLPQRFRGGRECTQPFFCFEDGAPLTRQFVQDVLEQAALACGYDPRRFRSHSLRIGGATAFYHVRPDVQLIQRFGRWSSSAVQGCLWEAHETSRGISAAMAADKTVLHNGRTPCTLDSCEPTGW